MIRVRVYLKSGAVAEFDAAAIAESGASGESHPKFRLEFSPPIGAEPGTQRLVYLDRDDVSAVVVEERGGRAAAMEHATASAPVEVPDAIRQEVKEVLEGAAGT